MFARQAAEARISSEFPAFAGDIFGRAVNAGYAEQEVAALIKVLR